MPTTVLEYTELAYPSNEEDIYSYDVVKNICTLHTEHGRLSVSFNHLQDIPGLDEQFLKKFGFEYQLIISHFLKCCGENNLSLAQSKSNLSFFILLISSLASNEAKKCDSKNLILVINHLIYNVYQPIKQTIIERLFPVSYEAITSFISFTAKWRSFSTEHNIPKLIDV